MPVVPRAQEPPMPTITAHRGSSAAAPENTLAAFRQAIRDRADGAELDVHQAADGTLVVTHDVHLARVAGVDANIWELTGEELGRLDVGSHFARAFRGEPLPTLEQVIELVRGHLRLNVELKKHGHESGYAVGVIETLRSLRFANACVVTARDVELLREVRRAAPELVIGLILEDLTDDVMRHDVDLFSVHRAIASTAFVDEARDLDRAVHVWTVDDPADMVQFATYGVNDLITNVPRLAREVLGE